MKYKHFDTAFPFEMDKGEQTSYGLTKLELISAMCLQGVLANGTYNESPFESANWAIAYAKELLKQLDTEND
jgi:hypothetical protein